MRQLAGSNALATSRLPRKPLGTNRGTHTCRVLAAVIRQAQRAVRIHSVKALLLHEGSQNSTCVSRERRAQQAQSTAGIHRAEASKGWPARNGWCRWVLLFAKLGKDTVRSRQAGRLAS